MGFRDPLLLEDNGEGDKRWQPPGDLQVAVSPCRRHQTPRENHMLARAVARPNCLFQPAFGPFIFCSNISLHEYSARLDVVHGYAVVVRIFLEYECEVE